MVYRNGYDWDAWLRHGEYMRSMRDRNGQRLAATGDRWAGAARVDVTRVADARACRADPAGRAIWALWPTTTRLRLFNAALQIGHVLLDHRGKRPKYIEEYQAQLFAHRLMAGEGLKVPYRATDRARARVYDLIGATLDKTNKKIDPHIANWAIKSVPVHRRASRSLIDTLHAEVNCALSEVRRSA